MMTQTPRRCFIMSLAQVSCQRPLSEEWLTDPLIPAGEYAPAIEPDSRAFIPPAEARRTGKLIRRAVCAAMSALAGAGNAMPDAVITATGMGCMDNSEKFLMDLCLSGEPCRRPTLFMQSTHNTVGSHIARLLGCHGYNCTYSHNGISFESALLDAWIRIRSGLGCDILVNACDEVTPLTAKIMRHTRPGYAMISEASVSAMLSPRQSDGAVEVSSVRLLHRPTDSDLAEALAPSEGEAIMTGCNGREENDRHYLRALRLAGKRPLHLRYRHIFGDSLSASATGFYAAATMLRRRIVPPFMIGPVAAPDTDSAVTPPDRITLINHSDGLSWSVITLSLTK